MRIKIERNQLSTNKLVEVSKNPKVIVYYNGQNYYAFSGICPHAKWPLELGKVNDTTITCAGHSWEFNIAHGNCVSNPGRDLKCYKVQVNDDEIIISD